MAYTYIVQCADDSFYVGSTRNLDARLQQHAIGAVPGHTSRHRPVRLVWFLELERIDEAFELERRIHGWRRDKKIALIEGRIGDLPMLSRSRAASSEIRRDVG